MFTPLSREFYLPSAEIVAPLLLRHYLLRRTPQGIIGGLIVETEAYLHNDPACHAAPGPTRRNAPMYGPPGHAYVYLNYGVHPLVIVVTEPEQCPAAILIRAL